MALIRRAVPCVVQPQPDSALNINWANPLTRRLGLAVIPWSNQQHVDVLTGHFKKQTYWTQKGTEIGRALYFSGSGSDAYTAGGATWAAATEAITLVGVIERFSTGDTTSEERTVSLRTVSIHALAIGYSGTNGWYSTAKPTGLTSTLIPGTIDTSVRAVAVARYNPATGDHDLWINGIQVASVTNSAANWQADFNNGGGGAASRSRGYYLSAGFGRWLSDTEVREISRNPWQIFSQQRPFAFDATVAGGDLSVTATLATATASGYTAGVDRQLGVTASLATATASGYTASLSSDLSIAASLATATASGYAAGVDRQLGVTASLATATASGYDAGISTGLQISAALAEATGSGYLAAVNLQLGVTATLAEAAASGYTASLNTSSFSQDDLDFLLAYIQENLVVPTASEIAAAVLAAAAVTPIDANVKEVNDVAIAGTGVPPTYDVTLPTVLDPGDPWRPA